MDQKAPKLGLGRQYFHTQKNWYNSDRRNYAFVSHFFEFENWLHEKFCDLTKRSCLVHPSHYSGSLRTPSQSKKLNDTDTTFIQIQILWFYRRKMRINWKARKLFCKLTIFPPKKGPTSCAGSRYPAVNRLRSAVCCDQLFAEISCLLGSAVCCDQLFAVIFCKMWSAVCWDQLFAVISCFLLSSVRCDQLFTVISCLLWSAVCCDQLFAGISCLLWSAVCCYLL